MDKSSTPSAIPVSKNASEQLSSEQVSLENTFKMGPDQKLQLRGVQDLVKKILWEIMHNFNYDAMACSDIASELAEKINTKIRMQIPNRFKLVTFVVIGPKEASSVIIGSRCLWDIRFDHFLEEVYQNSSAYAVATIYIMYQE